jgi:APA family basic amino acid/polyamine antiporter
MVIFAQFIFYGAIALGVILLRKRMPEAQRPFKCWGYPAVPVFYILFCIALFINTIMARPREAAIGMILILAGIPVYFFLRKNYNTRDFSETNEL